MKADTIGSIGLTEWNKYGALIRRRLKFDPGCRTRDLPVLCFFDLFRILDIDAERNIIAKNIYIANPADMTDRSKQLEIVDNRLHQVITFQDLDLILDKLV